MSRETKLNTKAVHLVICIFCAFFLWIYVSYVVSPEITITITNIPVTVTGEDKLNKDGLSAKLISDDKVDVKVTAKRSQFRSITTKNARATVDVSSLTDEGNATLKATVSFVSVVVPAGDINTDKATLDFVVTPYASRKLPVEINVSKEPTGGYYVKDKIPVTESDKSVQVSGGENDVNAVYRVKTEKVDLSNVSDTVTKELSLICVDESGAEIEGLKLTPEKVSVTFEIYKEATIPLTVDIPEGEEKTEYILTPKEVKVTGPAAAVDALTEIKIGNLNDLKYRTSGSIRLEEGIVFAEDEVNTRYEITFPTDEGEGDL